jgi:energy-coupling factor transport system ATP-binding protein
MGEPAAGPVVAETAADSAIELRNCSYSYDGSIPALQRVSCSIEPGSWVALVGENGSGKSTLARLCNGLLRPWEGQVFVNGENIRGRPVGEVAREVGFLFQNPDHQLFAPTVREEIAFDLRNLGFPRQEIAERIEEALTLFGLSPYADRPPAVLGYGLRRQVTLASVLARRPSILILDEPTTGLDWQSTEVLMGHVGEQHEAGCTVLLITHDMRLIAERAASVLLLHEGRMVAAGPTRELFAQPELLDRASISPPPITELSQRFRPAGMRGDSLTVDAFVQEFEALLPETGDRG